MADTPRHNRPASRSPDLSSPTNFPALTPAAPFQVSPSHSQDDPSSSHSPTVLPLRDEMHLLLRQQEERLHALFTVHHQQTLNQLFLYLQPRPQNSSPHGSPMADANHHTQQHTQPPTFLPHHASAPAFTPGQTSQSTTPNPMPTYNVVGIQSPATQPAFFSQSPNTNPFPRQRVDFLKFAEGNPHTWIHKAHQYFNYYRVPPHEWVVLATMHLDEPAACWYQGLDNSDYHMTWEMFVDALRKRFGPTQFDDAIGALARLQQTGTVAAYQTMFDTIAGRSKETALRLESLVGDLEDAASSLIKKDSGFQLEYFLVAIGAMKNIDEVLANVANVRPYWINLLKAVDSRVEKALSILRLRCLADHRILVASLGWPPSLSTMNAEKDKFMEVPNPLSLMQGQKKDKYCRSFSALCSLQNLQAKRERRLSFIQGNQMACSQTDLKGMDGAPLFKNDLWAVDELVKPIASSVEYHFSRWLDQPKFIFALAYKIAQNFIDGVEDILQPLIDRAMLPGCSAKEAWVVAMAKLVSGFLEEQVFPVIAKAYSRMKVKSDSNSSLLHLIDLMISFDKQMRILAASGTHMDASFTAIEGFAPSMSVMSIFSEHSDWLQMWADMEVCDAEGKLTPLMNDESSWSVVRSTYEEEESFILSSREDYKAPLMAESVLRLAQEMIERGSSLPCSRIRNEFLVSSTNLFLNEFFGNLFRRIQDVEYMAAVLDDVQLSRVCSSMNAARYCQHVLYEWNEDANSTDMSELNAQNCLYKDGATFLANLQTDCLEKIATALLVHFDNLCWNYVQDSDRWAMDGVDSPEEDYLCISPNFIEALDMLRDRIQFLKMNLNSPDLLDLWRSIAGGLDHYIFTSIPMSNASFSSPGVHQFRTDMEALFLAFRPFCARPEAFFPCIGTSLKLLEVGGKDADRMLELFSQGRTGKEDWLRSREIFRVSLGQAEKVLRNRIRA